MSPKWLLAVVGAVLVVAWLAYRGCGGTPSAVRPPLAPSAPDVAASAPLAVESAASPHEPATTPARSVAPTAPASETKEEPPSTIFSGSLRDPSGKLLAGLWSAGVSVTDADGRRRFADAKDTGSFAMAALPYGTYWVCAGADGFHEASATIQFDAAHAHVQRDFTLRPIPIVKVRVTTLDGKSLYGEEHPEMQVKGHPMLVPVATKERPTAWFNEVTGSLNNPFGIGQFWQYGPRVEQLPKGYMGILMLREDPPAYVSLVNYHRVLQTKELQPGEDEVNFQVSIEDLDASMGSLRMQIVDAVTHEPVVGANAQLWGGASMGRGTPSDKTGAIVVDSQEPGEFDLHVMAKGYEEYKAHVLVDSGAPTDLGRIELDKAVSVVIHVVDGTGAPCSGEFVVGVLDPRTGTLNMERQQRWKTKGDGVLTLSTLGRHVYVVRSANHDAVNDQGQEGTKWVSGNVRLDSSTGAAPANFRIQMSAATRVMIVRKNGDSDGARFQVTDAQGLELVSSRFYGDGPRPLSLPPGTYKIALLDADKSVIRERSIVVGSQTMTVELAR